ncbi:MAG TPA: hypothetical protein VLX91_13585, partial [Candidatus Acidoferrales bacterium]|nr:hypothetical protein [Candidatus Acidoferrales bacterium]
KGGLYHHTTTMGRLWGIFFPALSIVVSTAIAINAAQGQNSEKDTTDLLQNLSFRNIGPAAAGGRVTAVVGIPGNPNIYYVGAAGGGVFKTIDGGISWKAVFEKEPSLSVGAIATAPSNPNFLWVGTGEGNLRNDIITGKGVYFSPDAGKSWQEMGLNDAGQISRIAVDPSNPNIVFVAAIGHAWGTNPDRGVFRTSDCGKTWQKVLFVNDTTGASDLIIDPGNPMILFAAMWQVQRHPWSLDNGGNGSGLYRSIDGGTTWKKLADGLPKGPVGRIALSAAMSNPNHVYALIEAKDGLLWDSNDLGDHWKMVSNNHALDVRPFYFSRFAVSPSDEDKLYFLSFLISKSTDGGKTAKSINGEVHVDHHDIWIDPQNPDRIILGNDGGVYLSLDGGDTWRFLNNLPIGQFYQVAVDNNTPYNLGGGLQDNNAWYGTSHNLYGPTITGQNWFILTGGDGEYVVPSPSDPDIVYSESQNGWLSRIDLKTGIQKLLRPYLFDAPDMPPSQLKYRFNWTTPIAVAANDENEVYLGANVLLKSMDGGTHWEAVSPDLTRNDKSKQIASGGKIELDMSGAENFDTILSIGISPFDSNIIWIGTDDGLVQVTLDGGNNWENVSENIPHLPEWGRVYQVEPSSFDKGTCYVTIDFHELDNNKPYVFKTDDFGKSWKSISKGLPEGYPAHVVREDPNKQAFLVLGTDHGLYYSTDDGEQWRDIKSNCPAASVFDLKFVKQTHDLVVATHGRGIFIFDNITTIEEYNDKVAQEQFHLFTTLPACMFHTWHRDGFSDLSTYSAPNPPEGAVIDYYLKDTISTTPSETEEHKTPVTIEITSQDGKHVATLYGTDKKGFNRLVWNLRYQSASLLKLDNKEPEKADPFTTNGPLVVPGIYKIAVTVNGKTSTNHVEVKPDPRLETPMDFFASNTNNGLNVRNEMSALNDMLNRIQNIRDQIATIKKSIGTDEDGMKSGKYETILAQLDSLDKKFASLKDTVYSKSIQHEVGEDDIHDFSDFHSQLETMTYVFASPYSGVPGESMMGHAVRLKDKLSEYLDLFNGLLGSGVSSYNKVALENLVPTIFAGPRIEIEK